MEDRTDHSILYIMGRGHSGSTILDLMLGNHEQIHTAGELTNGFRVTTALCSCYALLDDCEFWSGVRRELQERHPETSLDDFRWMLSYIDRFYRIPQIITGLGLPAWVKERYEPFNSDLYAEISRRADKPIVLDSSKTVVRAVHLVARHPERTKVIHLVRDGRGEMWSRLRRLRSGKPYQILSRELHPKRHWPFMIVTALTWTAVNGVSLLFRWIKPRHVLQVRYEDLCRDTQGELQRIGDFLGVDMSEVTARLDRGEPFDIGHNVSGNPVVHSESRVIQFKPDTAWKSNLPRRYRWLFFLFGFPLALYFGYLRDS